MDKYLKSLPKDKAAIATMLKDELLLLGKDDVDVWNGLIEKVEVLIADAKPKIKVNPTVLVSPFACPAFTGFRYSKSAVMIPDTKVVAYCAKVHNLVIKFNRATCTASEYVRIIQTAVLVNWWHEDQVLLFVKVLLSGNSEPVAEWYRSSMLDDESFDDLELIPLINAFLNHFRCECDTAFHSLSLLEQLKFSPAADIKASLVVPITKHLKTLYDAYSDRQVLILTYSKLPAKLQNDILSRVPDLNDTATLIRWVNTLRTSEIPVNYVSHSGNPKNYNKRKAKRDKFVICGHCGRSKHSGGECISFKKKRKYCGMCNTDTHWFSDCKKHSWSF